MGRFNNFVVNLTDALQYRVWDFGKSEMLYSDMNLNPSGSVLLANGNRDLRSSHDYRLMHHTGVSDPQHGGIYDLDLIKWVENDYYDKDGYVNKFHAVVAIVKLDRYTVGNTEHYGWVLQDIENPKKQRSIMHLAEISGFTVVGNVFEDGPYDAKHLINY